MSFRRSFSVQGAIEEKRRLDNEAKLEKKITEKFETKNSKLLDEISELKNALTKKEEERITANRQLLILHYTGILDIFNFAKYEDMYEFFHFIIDKNKPAVKAFFLNRYKTDTEQFMKIFNADDLIFLSNLFQKQGLKQPLEKVNADILKFKY